MVAKENLPDLQSIGFSAFPRTIVSFDGGGTRGLFSAKFIEIVESKYNILDYVTTFAGTSTGSIIAIALAFGAPPNEIVSFYLNDMVQVFPKRSFDTVKTVYEKAIVKPHYDSDTLKSILIKVLHKYGIEESTTLGSCQKHVVVTAHRCSDGKNIIFDSEDRNHFDWTIIDVIMCSCSAPYYFEPYKADDGYEYIDGGILSNNPAQHAIDSLLLTEKEAGLINLLSIGTGQKHQDLMVYVEEFAGHPFRNFDNFTETLFVAQNQKTEDYCTKTLDKNRYLRINPDCQKKIALNSTDDLDYLILKAETEFLLRIDDINKWIATVRSLPEVMSEKS